jgi:hypothetical protein
MPDFSQENTDGICSNKNRVTMIAYNDHQRIAVGFAPRCKQWSCPECGKANAYLWKLRVRAGMNQLLLDGIEMRFLTLTSHGKLNASQSLYVWPKGWKKFRTRVQREVEHDFYIAVPERQGNGKIHLHILESWGLETRWYKDNAAACGLGFMALEEEMPSPAHAAWYVCKYLTKSIEKPEEWPTGFRRVRCSQSWPDLEQRAKGEYRFEKVTDGIKGERVLLVANMEGYEVFIADHKASWVYLEGEKQLSMTRYHIDF